MDGIRPGKSNRGIFHSATLAGNQQRKYLKQQTGFIRSLEPREGPSMSVQEK